MKTLRFVTAILATLILSTLSVQAGSSAVMQVSATIRPWVVFRAVQNSYSYSVTSNDLKRGYVEVAGSITLNIKTNLKREISVRFSNENGERILFKESTDGKYFESDYTMYPDRYIPGEEIIKKIDSRIILTADSREGLYALNVSMSPEI